MDGILLAARLFLAIVFAAAGIGKAADLAGSRRAVAGFGVPKALAQPIGVLLPFIELGIAAALLLQASAWIGAVAGLLLLLGFIAGISINLARGRTPDCHCFGQIYSEPVGRQTLARNGILAVVAASIVILGKGNAGTDPFSWYTTLTTAQRADVVLGTIIAGLLGLQAWFLAQMTRQNKELLQRVTGLPALAAARAAESEMATESTPAPGLPVGAPAPLFTLPDLNGRMTTLDDLLVDGNPALLFFTSPSCAPCSALMPDIAGWQRQYAGRLTLAVIGEGTSEENRSKAEAAGVGTVLVQREREIAAAYDVPATPGAVVVFPEGIIASPVALGSDSIHGLIDQALEVVGRARAAAPLVQLQDQAPAREPVPAESDMNTRLLTIGTPLPSAHVTHLTGETAELADLIEGETLVLFWRSTCGFCQQMLPTLQAWEANPPAGAPDLLVVLSATPNSKQIISFRSTTVIDREGEAARVVGANGTPMAVLIDSERRVASPVVAGADDVMDLANGTETRATA